MNCNIWKQKCKLIIPKGYEICPVCKGLGCSLRNPRFKQRAVEAVQCHFCDGEGIVDWVKFLTSREVNNIKPIPYKYMLMKCRVICCK